MEYDNNLRGVLFPNNRKREGKRDPDYTGNAEIDGISYFVDGWINSSKQDGKKFLSLKFKPKGAPAGAARLVAGSDVSPSAAAVADDFDDLIPF